MAKDEETKARYLEALGRSSLNGMMNYYRQNYPKAPYREQTEGIPNVAVPVLQFHGLNDTALHHHGLNETWEWVDKDYTLVTIPGVGHWAQEDLTIQYPIDPDPAKECQCVQRHDDRPHSK